MQSKGITIKGDARKTTEDALKLRDSWWHLIKNMIQHGSGRIKHVTEGPENRRLTGNLGIWGCRLTQILANRGTTRRQRMGGGIAHTRGRISLT